MCLHSSTGRYAETRKIAMVGVFSSYRLEYILWEFVIILCLLTNVNVSSL